MAITLSNGVTNLKNTPSAITDVFANIPNANSVSEGCIFISTDTAEFYTNVNGSWVLIGGGGGGVGTINQVLALGDTATDKQQIFVETNTNQFTNTIEADQLIINDNVANSNCAINAYGFDYKDNNSGNETFLGNDINNGISYFMQQGNTTHLQYLNNGWINRVTEISSGKYINIQADSFNDQFIYFPKGNGYIQTIEWDTIFLVDLSVGDFNISQGQPDIQQVFVVNGGSTIFNLKIGGVYSFQIMILVKNAIPITSPVNFVANAPFGYTMNLYGNTSITQDGAYYIFGYVNNQVIDVYIS